MSALEELAAFRRERNEAFRTLDLAWARKWFPGTDADDAMLLVGLHKARYNCTDIESALRMESAEWLRERGLHDIGGMEILPPGQLPIGV